jgi:hypothetical protein
MILSSTKILRNLHLIILRAQSMNKTDEMPLGENREFPFRESMLTFKNSSKGAQIFELKF